MRKILLRVIICCLFVLGVTGTAVWSDPSAVGPDDPAYIANMIEKALQVGSIQDPAEKILGLLEMAESRMLEIERMATENKPEYIPGSVEVYKAIVRNIEDTAQQATAEGIDLSEALEAVERSTKNHTQVLTDLLDQIPEQAIPAIEHAIEVSKRGRNVALDILERIQRGELPIEKPEVPGKPEDTPEGPPEDAPLGPPEDTPLGPPVEPGKPEKSER